jgi:hypothetical protein
MHTIRPAVALFLASVLLAGPTVAAEKSGKKEKKPVADQFTGTLATTTGPTAGGLGQPVTIWIDEYTSDEVAQSLMKTLADGGQIALRDALQNHRAGRIRVGENTSYPLAIARQHVGSDGRIVRLATNSPLTGYQLNQGLRSQDYPISFIELKLKADGTGEGTVVGMAKVSFDDEKNLSIASFGTQPSRLMNVETAPKKK